MFRNMRSISSMIVGLLSTRANTSSVLPMTIPASLRPLGTPIALVAQGAILGRQHVLGAARGARQIARIGRRRGPQSGLTTRICELEIDVSVLSLAPRAAAALVTASRHQSAAHFLATALQYSMVVQPAFGRP